MSSNIYFKRKLLIFMTTFIIVIVFFSWYKETKFEYLIEAGSSVAGYELYYYDETHSFLDFHPRVQVIYEDKDVEVLVFCSDVSSYTPEIKMWFGYITVARAFGWGIIDIEDIRESESSLFVVHDKMIVKNILDAERIEISKLGERSDLPNLYTSIEEWVLTATSLNEFKDIMIEKKFMENRSINRIDKLYEVRTYDQFGLTSTVYISDSGRMYERICRVSSVMWGCRVASDTIDLELFEELLLNN